MDNTSKCKPLMSLSALGATLAMVPMPFLMILVALKIFRPNSPDIAIALMAVQVIGCIIWAIGQFNLAGALSRLGHGSGSAKAIGTVVIIAGLFQAICLLTKGEIFEKTMRGNMSLTAVGYMLIALYLAIHTTLWISCNKLSKLFSGMKTAATGYATTTIVPVIVFIIALVLYQKARNSYDYYAYHSFEKTMETVVIIAAIVLAIAIVLCVIGWWNAISDADDITDDNEYDVQAVTTVETAAPSKPEPLTELQKQSLMSFDDNRLQEIIDNPTLFANPLYVGEADNILKKRRAWEAVNEKTDDELMAILHAPEGQYDYPTLDAVSMELASRETPLFVAMIESYSTADLQDMVQNPGSYYDGYVTYARKVLSQRNAQ